MANRYVQFFWGFLKRGNGRKEKSLLNWVLYYN